MQSFVALALQHPHAARGFTIIELMIVVVIVGVLITLGAPALSEFIADQRVRTTTSDIMAEIAFARAKALESSRRVYIVPNGGAWNTGWSIFVDLDSNGTLDPGEVVKTFNGFPAGNMRVCSTVGEFAANVTFRPDGRIVRASALNPNDGIYVVDTMGDAAVQNNKIRGILFGGAGRPTVVELNGTAPLC